MLVQTELIVLKSFKADLVIIQPLLRIIAIMLSTAIIRGKTKLLGAVIFLAVPPSPKLSLVSDRYPKQVNPLSSFGKMAQELLTMRIEPETIGWSKHLSLSPTP